jgi:hypothetical protein
MSKPRVCLNFADLLDATNSAPNLTRIETVQLPNDTALMDRFALVIAGPEAADIITLIVDSLDAHFTKSIAAQAALSESHGPGSSAQRPD